MRVNVELSFEACINNSFHVDADAVWPPEKSAQKVTLPLTALRSIAEDSTSVGEPE